MKKEYTLTCHKTFGVTVKADNLMEAISLIQNEGEISDTSEILINDDILEDEGGTLLLCDIAPCDYDKY